MKKKTLSANLRYQNMFLGPLNAIGAFLKILTISTVQLKNPGNNPNVINIICKISFSFDNNYDELFLQTG